MRKHLYLLRRRLEYMKKILKSIFVSICIFLLLSPISFAADDVKFKEQIKKEDGSLFEKIIAECIRWHCTNNI